METNVVKNEEKDVVVENNTQESNKKDKFGCIIYSIFALNVVSLALSVIAIIFILFTFLSDSKPCNAVVLVRGNFTTIEEETDMFDIDIEENVEQDYIELPFVEEISVNSKAPKVVLYNPEFNAGKFEIKYTFTNQEDAVILETDWIRTDTPYELNVSEYFSEGTTVCTCTISGRYIETEKPANGSEYKIVVNYKEVD